MKKNRKQNWTQTANADNFRFKQKTRHDTDRVNRNLTQTGTETYYDQNTETDKDTDKPD